MRYLWKDKILEAHSIIFIIDSTDRRNFEEAKTELHIILEMIKGIPCHILSSKTDIPYHMTMTDILERLDIQKFIDWNGNL